ncbi:MAG TPA: DUF1573 domain-containing protein, partial [Candidatus Paceibacterota bacterium]|nr:DUF1573 domain-containing protein [Candidatus Paceibacterota bacterium]
MKSNRIFFGALACVIFVAARLLADEATPTNTAATTPTVYVPDTTHENDPMPDGVLAWDRLMESTNAAADQEQAHFNFSFTNVSSGNVAILNVHPSCGCTTAQLPLLPWIVTSGTSGQIPITVNIAGRPGTIFKYVDVFTDKGTKRLNLSITILPPVIPTLSDQERAAGVAAAKIDRQAVFRNDCATCHVKNGEGKYGQELFDADCAICHEASPRATMVPDLHTLKVYT